MTTISVLIATRDRPAELARCLPTVLANEAPDFEVVVVDQSTGDATEQLVARLGDRRVHYRRQRTAGLSRARNAAIAAASGAIYACTDDDCTVPPGWLDRIAAVFAREEQAGLIFGAFRAVPHDPDRFYVPSFDPGRYRRLSGPRATYRPEGEAGGTMAIRRRVAAAVGPFDPCLGPGGPFPSGEDTDFTNRALRAGFAVVHDPENVVDHWGARPYADGSAQRLVLGTSLAVGALLAKELRCGNPFAPYALLRLLAAKGARVARRPAGGRRPGRVEHLRSWAVGFGRGLRHPLDCRRGLFVPVR